MKRIITLLVLLACGCSHTPTTTPLPPSAPHLNDASNDRLSQISANAAASEYAANYIADTNVQAAVKGPLSVIQKLAGPATDKARADALAIVVDALAGNLSKANAAWAKAKNDADGLNARIAALEKQVKDEQAAAAAEIDRLKKENEAKQARFVVIVLASVSGLVLTASIALAVFLVWSGTATPKGLAACALGAACAIGGFAITQFLAHPWVPYVVGGIAVLLLIIGFIIWLKEHFDINKAKQIAEDGLDRVGEFMTEMRKSALTPEVKHQLETMIDGVTDRAHQEKISTAAHP